MELPEGGHVEYFPHLVQGHPQWHAARQACDYGSSEIGALLGISRFKSRAKLFRIKNGEQDPDPSNQYMQAGHYYEDIVVRNIAPFYAPASLRTYGMVKLTTASGLKLGCSPDRLIVRDEKIIGAVEVKTHHSYYEGVRIEHLLQMLLQAKCFDVPFVHYAVQIIDEPLPHATIYEITFDDDLWPLILQEIEAAHKLRLAKEYGRVASADKDRVCALLTSKSHARLWYRQGYDPATVSEAVVEFYN